MIIDTVEVYYVVLPLIYPWRTAYGEDKDIHTVLVRITSAQDEGWGEACPFAAPTYSPEYAMSTYYLISELFAPAVVGLDISSGQELLERLRQYKGNPFAKGGIESAYWLLHSVVEKQPLHCLLGGETHNVDAGADFGVQDSYEILLGKIHSAIEKGYKRVKLKVRPGWDLEILQVVRSTFPDLTMHIDCNAGYSLNDISFFKAVDKLNLAMIEQPLDSEDLFGHSILQKEITTPICLDESIKSIYDLQLALQIGSCKVLNIKYGRVGGLTTAIKLHNMAKDAGIACWVGSMLESAIGSGINIELATLSNFRYPADLFESNYFYKLDVTNLEIVMNTDCTFTPSSVPGTPYKPNLKRLEKLSQKKAIVELQKGQLNIHTMDFTL